MLSPTQLTLLFQGWCFLRQPQPESRQWSQQWAVAGRKRFIQKWHPITVWTITRLQLRREHGEVDTIKNKCLSCFQGLFPWVVFLMDLIALRRVRLRSDGAAIPRRRSGTETHSPTRVVDTPPRAAACPSSPHKMSVSKGRVESPEKRRLGTFGSAGSINYPDRKAYPDGHPLRLVPGATRHSSLGDHKTLETEALAEVRLCH